MKKMILLAVLLTAFAALSWGQSLQDNQYYQKMVELKDQSEVAFEKGDYIEARRLAEEAQTYKVRSDEWIENQLTAYRARASLVRLKERLQDAARVKADVNFPDEYAEARSLYNKAYSQFYDESAYAESLETSRKALDLLSVVQYVGPKNGLPAYYKVRLLPGNTDCLWNIAGYDFIYGKAWQWKKIYEANKDKMPQENNPDLIHPEMILTIPALEGESRSGTWDNGVIQ